MNTRSTTGKKVIDVMVNSAEWIVTGIGGLILIYLTVQVLRFRFNVEDSIQEKGNPAIQILYFAAVVLMGFLLGKILNGAYIKWPFLDKFFLIAVLTGITVWGINYLTQVCLLPESDEQACFNIAEQFLHSDFSAVTPTGSYLSLWPFQTGFIFILEKQMRLFGTDRAIFFQICNLLYILLLITSGYGILRIMTKRLDAALIYLMLMGTHCTLLFRITSVYGEIPAWGLMMLGTWLLFWARGAQKGWCKNLLCAMFFCVSVLACTYKSNALIWMIAVLLAVFMDQLKKHSSYLLYFVIPAMILGACSTKITQKYYESYAHETMGRGVPAVSYLAMGLQYNGEDAIWGGWNGYHSELYMSTGYDYEETVRISRESIRDSWKAFREDPDLFKRFFLNKTIKQWANQTHGLYWGYGQLYDTKRDPSAYWVSYIEGRKFIQTAEWEEYHEGVLYLFLLLYAGLCIMKKIRKQQIDLIEMIPMIAMIGGFLFSLIWEGQSSAVVIYPVLLLPVSIGTEYGMLEKYLNKNI